MGLVNKADVLTVSLAPHIRGGQTISKVMWTVVIALLPAVCYSVYIFGARVVSLIATSVLSAIIVEAVMQFVLKKRITALDGSAAITGLLIAMNVPPAAPLWMVGMGSAFAIIVVKQLFGGLGFNVFNPALAARAFMMSSWPAHMTTGWHRFSGTNRLAGDTANTFNFPPEVFDAMTGATPLTTLKEGSKLLEEFGISLKDFSDFLLSPDILISCFTGNIGGCIGETSGALLLLGGLFLMFRKVITWHIPVSFIGTVWLMSIVCYWGMGYPDPFKISLFHVFTGGLMLGAFFMATDMVTSPVTKKGMIIFGIGCGIITFLIRIWGGYPEGVSYGILLMNAVTPLIDRLIKPKVFGFAKEG